MRSIKNATFHFDATTLQTLNRLARRWWVSKSEAIRRALRELDETSADFQHQKKTPGVIKALRFPPVREI
jgi:metal-responsive CopG/Arc/MetJ family transcriptional regulator